MPCRQILSLGETAAETRRRPRPSVRPYAPPTSAIDRLFERERSAGSPLPLSIAPFSYRQTILLSRYMCANYGCVCVTQSDNFYRSSSSPSAAAITRRFFYAGCSGTAAPAVRWARSVGVFRSLARSYIRWPLPASQRRRRPLGDGRRRRRSQKLGSWLSEWRRQQFSARNRSRRRRRIILSIDSRERGHPLTTRTQTR